VPLVDRERRNPQHGSHIDIARFRPDTICQFLIHHHDHLLCTPRPDTDHSDECNVR